MSVLVNTDTALHARKNLQFFYDSLRCTPYAHYAALGKVHYIPRSDRVPTGDTHSKTGDPARPERPRQDKSIYYQYEESNEPTKKGPLLMVLFGSPHSHQLQPSAGTTPLWSLWCQLSKFYKGKTKPNLAATQ